MNLKIYTFLLLLFLSAQVSAQSFLNVMDTVTISTAKIPQTINQTGRSIIVVSGAELNKFPVTSVDELLRYLPGIELQSRNGFGAQADIIMRGSTFAQVLVLLDGMRLNDPLTAHFNSNIPITPAEIDRIEIMKGPAAAIYGPDAVGGVINIISKTFKNRVFKEEKQVEVALNYGEENLINGNAGGYFSTQKFAVGGGVLWNQSEGQLIAENTIISDGDTTNLEAFRNNFDIKTISGSFAIDLGKYWSMAFRTAYDYRDFSARYFYTRSAFDKSVETTTNWWNHLKVSRITGKSSTSFDLSYKYNTDEFIFNPAFTPNNHKTNFFNAIINHYQVINEQFSLSSGLQIDNRNISSNDRGDHNDWHIGAFLIGAYRPNTMLNLTGSLRADYDENYDFELSPQINFSYINNNLTIRAAGGRSIRAADYTERYVSNNLPAPISAGRNFGNPNLNAERSWSAEVGADYEFNSLLSVKFTGFTRSSANLIDYVLTNEADIFNNQNLTLGANYFYATNVTDVRTNGIETELWSSFEVPADFKIRLGLGHTFLQTTNEEDVISVYISSHARHLFNTNFEISKNRISLNLNGIYKKRDPREALAIDAILEESYFVWNGRLNIGLSNNFTAQVQVINLFNIQYSDILGSKMPDRWLMGGIKWSLK